MQWNLLNCKCFQFIFSNFLKVFYLIFYNKFLHEQSGATWFIRYETYFTHRTVPLPTYTCKRYDVIPDLWWVEPRISLTYSEGPCDFDLMRFDCIWHSIIMLKLIQRTVVSLNNIDILFHITVWEQKHSNTCNVFKKNMEKPPKNFKLFLFFVSTL